MCFEFEFDARFFESCKAHWLSSKTRKHGIPLPGIMKRRNCLKNSNSSFTASPRATYSASEIERVVEMAPNQVMSEMVLDEGGHFIPAGIFGLHT